MKLDKEEKIILNAYEKGDFKSIPHVKKEIARYREYAKYTLKKKINALIYVFQNAILSIYREKP